MTSGLKAKKRRQSDKVRKIRSPEDHKEFHSVTSVLPLFRFFTLLIVCLLSSVMSLSSGCSLSYAATPEPPLMPSNYVVDLAGIIRDDVEAQLNSYLKELEQKTTAQVVVLTVQSLDGEDIESFSLRTAEKWKLGQKGKDNGLLITVALQDRRYRFEVGYGLESILPDSLVGSIGRQYIVPYFRKGDYSTGIFNATIAVVKTISASEGVVITGMPKITERSKEGTKREFIIHSIASLIVLMILFLQIFGLIYHRRHKRSGWSGFFLGGSGGGFGGGGVGGFGGGGGGGFGGGGASGSW